MWNEPIDVNELYGTITEKTVEFAERFGKYLAAGDGKVIDPLTTTQLRRTYGEVKR
jgi:hypothetical protein